MEKSLMAIGDQTLPSLLIPGTHDSGCYEIPPQETHWYELIGNIKKGFYLTQDETIFEQLVYGIRYLDLRVGYYDKLWIVHDTYRMPVTVDSAVQQVNRFLRIATKEIVILDFHRLVEGFESVDENIVAKRLEELYETLYSYLGDLFISKKLGFM